MDNPFLIADAASAEQENPFLKADAGQTPPVAEKKKPFLYRDDNGILHIGENLLDLSKVTKESTAISTLMNLPGAAAGAAATGQAIKATEGLRQSPLLPARALGTLGPLVYGMGAAALGGLGFNKTLEVVAPETKRSIDETLEAAPGSDVLGSVIANAPLFGVGSLEKTAMEALKARGVPAAIGAGLAAGQELATTGEIDPTNVTIAGLTNAAFNKPTRLGEGLMNAGARMVPKKPDAITSKLGNASTKSTVTEANQAANQIALETPNLPADVASLKTDADAQLKIALAEAAGEIPPEPAGQLPAGGLGDLGYIEAPGKRVRGLDTRRKPALAVEPTQAQVLAEAGLPTSEAMPARETELAAKLKAGESAAGPEPDRPVTETGESIVRIGGAEYAKIGGKWYRGNGREVGDPTVVKVLETKAEPVKITEDTVISEEPIALTPKVAQEAPKAPVEATPAPKPEVAPKAVEIPIPAQPTVLPESIQKKIAGKPRDKWRLSHDEWTQIEAFENKGGISGGKMGSESGSILNPFDGQPTEIGAKLLEKANEPLLEAMTRADFDASREARVQSRVSAWDNYIKGGPLPKEVETKTPQDSVQFPKPGEGRAPSAADQRAQKTVSYEKGLEPIYDTITGKENPEAVKRNAKIIYDRLTKQAADDGGTTPPREVADEIAKGPEDYVPFLTDIASRMPDWTAKFPGASVGRFASDIIGGVAKLARNKVGILETNIRDASPRVFGALREKVGELNEMRTDFGNRIDGLGKLARKSLTPAEFVQLDKAALSGDRAAIEALFATKPNKDELMAAFDINQQAKAEIRDAMIASGRDVGEIDTFFHRRLVDRDGLLKMLGKERTTYNDLLAAARREKGAAGLTQEEKDKILNNLIAGSIRNAGKPGFLKQRTIETITDDMLKFYEPFDVADNQYVMSATRDISNRKWFGKVSDDGEPFAGNFGRIVGDEIESGRLGKAQDTVYKNLQDYFSNSTRVDKDVDQIAGMVRKAQTYAYLADVANAIPQYADFFSAWAKYGVKNAASGYFNRAFKLGDINIHEGHNPDLADVSRAPSKNPESTPGKVVKAAGDSYNFFLRKFLGAADEVNKGGIANAAFKWVSGVVKDPSSVEFKRLNDTYSKMFPERWPAMLKDLQGPDFAAGKLNENTRFFLFNELANLQPIDASGRAQGYNEAGPWGKVLYSLRSYALKQLDILRETGYNKLKRGEFSEGIAKMAAYAFIVGVGQQVASFAKDLALQRKTDPLEYGITGLLQLAMVPRYAVFRAKEEGIGTAVLETLVPGVGVLNDISKDAQLLARKVTGQRDSQGYRTVGGLDDLFRQAHTTQYLPGVGREIYWWAGRGAQQEKKNATDKAAGKPKKTTAEMIQDTFMPPDLKTPRK